MKNQEGVTSGPHNFCRDHIDRFGVANSGIEFASTDRSILGIRR
jgi:hypothetical protein